MWNRMSSFMFLVIVVVTFTFCQSDVQQFSNCNGTENDIPFWDSKPVFVNSTTNGKLYKVGNASLNSEWNVIHLYGSDYEQGFAYGTLLGKEISQFYHDFSEFLKQYVDDKLEKFPKVLRDWIEQKGLWYLLDWVWEITEEYTPQYFSDLMQGISDASGTSFLQIRRVAVVTQLLELTACTILGAHHSATPTGNLIHVRGLDLTYSGAPEGNDKPFPMIPFPTVAVHHYSDIDGSRPVINFATAGYIGSITGQNPTMAFGSKEWNDFEGSEKLPPLPLSGWVANFHAFHILRYASSVEEVKSIVVEAKRTMPTYAGVSDGESNEFYGLEYQPANVTFFSWENQTESQYHPRFKDVVYWDKEFQPSPSPCFPDLLKKYLNEGGLTAEILVRKILPGMVVSLVWDFDSQTFYASFGYETWSWGKQYIKVDWQALFDEKSTNE